LGGVRMINKLEDLKYYNDLQNLADRKNVNIYEVIDIMLIYLKENVGGKNDL
jgi:hypothetical protein